MSRCTARPRNIYPAPRCIEAYGHGPEEAISVGHQSSDGVWWMGPKYPCPCGTEEDNQCECFGIDRLTWAQRNEREDADVGTAQP